MSHCLFNSSFIWLWQRAKIRTVIPIHTSYLTLVTYFQCIFRLCNGLQLSGMQYCRLLEANSAGHGRWDPRTKVQQFDLALLLGALHVNLG